VHDFTNTIAAVHCLHNVSTLALLLTHHSELMLQLDSDLGDIQADIADCQASLVRQLEDYLLSEEVYTLLILLLELYFC
jgi:hypothetical protein